MVVLAHTRHDPNAADSYKKKVQDLRAALAECEGKKLPHETVALPQVEVGNARPQHECHRG